MSQRLSGEQISGIKTSAESPTTLYWDGNHFGQDGMIPLEAEYALALLADLEEARAALREIVSIQIDTSLRPIDAANKMCRVAVDALVATEEIDG